VRLLVAAAQDTARLFRDGGPGARALYLAGAILMILGAAHLPVHLAAGAPWEGPLAWRKPILFGLSTGATLLSLGYVVGLLRWSGRFGLAVGAAAVFEVGLITLQTWRGVPSHFNGATPFDLAVYRGIEVGVAILAFGILALAVRSSRRLPLDGPGSLAVRAGMGLLVLGLAFGLHMTVHGHAAIATGAEAGRFGRAGVLKFVHGMPLHAIQILPVTAWTLARLEVPEPARLRSIAAMALGLAGTTGFAALQTYGGRDRFDVTVASATVLAASLALVAAPAVAAALRVLRPQGSSGV
jgi:hypothetical protein